MKFMVLTAAVLAGLWYVSMETVIFAGHLNSLPLVH